MSAFKFFAFGLGPLLGFFASGCVSVDDEAMRARQALLAGQPEEAVRWSERLATQSHYTHNLGIVEAGRTRMLAGDIPAAEAWFRQGVEAAMDRKEAQPKIKLGDVGNAFVASTITDDRMRNYYLAPYELNFALEYAILTEALNGKKDEALVDARLAVYVQDNLAATYGTDVATRARGKDAKVNQAADGVYAQQSSDLQEMMADTRNSWENPVLWWLTGVLFESDGDLEMAWQSYRKASAVKSDNPVFAAAAKRADTGTRTPVVGKAKLVVIYEEGLVPIRQSLKIPVPVYTGMSIDLPMYRESAYRPASVAVSGTEKLVSAAPAINVRALAARDLDEHLPGVIVRNITRAAVQAGAQAAVNANGNKYAQVAMFVGNVVVSAIRKADTRSWVTLPDGQQVWSEDAMNPGRYKLGVCVNGRTVEVPVNLASGETKLVWIADCGRSFRTAVASL